MELGRKRIARDLRRYYKHKRHQAVHQQEHLHEEQMAQQQWEAEQRLRVEATTLAFQTSTQMTAEFHAMEYDASAEMYDTNTIQVQEFAIKAEEAIDAQKDMSSPRKQWKKSDDVKMLHVLW